MARIRTYENDTTLSSDDKILGTDANGGINATSNFTVGDLKDFIESGINVVLKVPRGYTPIVNQSDDDVVAGSFRQDLTQLNVDVTFAPTGQHSNATQTNVLVGTDFNLIADGSSWKLEIANFRGRYYIPSFIGKTVEGVFGSNLTAAKFTIDALSQVDDKDYFINDDDFASYKFDITIDDDSDLSGIEGVENAYRSLNVLAADNPDGTLQEVLISFFGDVDMGDAHIDELDVDRIIFNQLSDPSVTGGEGIHYRTPAGTLSVVQNSNNLVIDGQPSHGFRVDLRTQINNDLGVAGKTTLVNTGEALEVSGTSDFNSDVNMDADLTVHGDQQILNSSELDFKISTDRMDGDNFENVIISKDGIDRRDHANNSFPITYVFANESRTRRDENDEGVDPTNEGVLTSIQIGDKTWTIPTAASQVAQLLPGLSEALSPTTEAINAGRFFYGTDKGLFATYEDDTSTQLDADLPIPADAITVTVPDGNGDDNDLNIMFSNVPFGQRLFFVDSTDNQTIIDANAGDDITEVTLYEVVSYIHSTRILTFTKLGAGNLIISAPTLSITNIGHDQDTTEFITLNDDLEVKTKSLADIAALSSQANYANQLDSNDFGTMQSIEFDSGPHGHNVDSGGGDLVIDVTGRMYFGDNGNHGHLQTTNQQALVWHGYVLGHITAAQTITLPDASLLKSGDTVRIANISDIYNTQDADFDPDNAIHVQGSQRVGDDVGALWSVIPFAGSRIMSLAADEEIVLNEASINEFIWSGNAAIGWIIK